MRRGCLVVVVRPVRAAPPDLARRADGDLTGVERVVRRPPRVQGWHVRDYRQPAMWHRPSSGRRQPSRSLRQSVPPRATPGATSHCCRSPACFWHQRPSRRPPRTSASPRSPRTVQEVAGATRSAHAGLDWPQDEPPSPRARDKVRFVAVKERGEPCRDQRDGCMRVDAARVERYLWLPLWLPEA